MACRSGTVGTPVSCSNAVRFSSERLKAATILISSDFLAARVKTLAQRPRPTMPTFTEFAVLVDNGQAVVEASIIIEHLTLNHPGPVRLIPADPKAALDVRTMDRV